MNDQVRIKQLSKKLAQQFNDYPCTVTPEMEAEKNDFIKSSKFQAHFQNQTFSLFNLQKGCLESHHVAKDENGLCIKNDFDFIQNSSQLLNYTHPDDKIHTLKLEITIMQYLQVLLPQEIENFGFSYQRRLKNNNGNFQCYIYQIKVAICDNNNRPWLIQVISMPCTLDFTEQNDRYRLFSIQPAKDIPKFKMLWNEVIIKLTKSEKIILLLIEKGLSKIEVAQKLSRSINTIRTHCNNILNKLSVNTIWGACIISSQLRMR